MDAFFKIVSFSEGSSRPNKTSRKTGFVDWLLGISAQDVIVVVYTDPLYSIPIQFFLQLSICIFDILHQESLLSLQRVLSLIPVPCNTCVLLHVRSSVRILTGRFSKSVLFTNQTHLEGLRSPPLIMNVNKAVFAHTHSEQQQQPGWLMRLDGSTLSCCLPTILTLPSKCHSGNHDVFPIFT